MARILLQQMLKKIPEEALPPTWRDLDWASFSETKTLWDYQQDALRNAVRMLWKYYEDSRDYRPDEDPEEANRRRKADLWWWYQVNGLREDFSVNPSRLDHPLASLLTERYETEYQAGGHVVPYAHFINRMGFWMATGSGKTLVIVKLVEVLWRLIRRGEIPPHPILILTHRDDLLEQLRRHVEEFNRGRSEPWILLRDLREYPQVLRESPTLFRDREAIVYYYRSDNLSDIQKERIVDFRNYENDGRWYILLDEAHKGDKEESKRQYIYSILSRNGFLFNFSATFTDPRDIITTGYNFNLERFITNGYGKHILILRQETRAFREKEDYNSEEKQRVVLKILLLAAVLQRVWEEVQEVRPDLYHRPLLLVLVNSVNTEDADLLLFFRELERIARGKVDEAMLEDARRELRDEFLARPLYLFEDIPAQMNLHLLERLTLPDLLRLVFHADGGGELEVLVRPSNRQELAFKVKTADRPFALIKIGDISGWLKTKLTGYEVNERFQDEGFFARLNEDDSDITILMGSRTFYEGWDSNRPNVIGYINIGVGEDARKFTLQSIGRGVRIEPLPGRRQRLVRLYDVGLREEWVKQILNRVAPLETLFVLGTNRLVLQRVVEGLQQERARAGTLQLPLFEVNPEAKECLLLVPVYRQSGRLLAETRQLVKFEVDDEELSLLQNLVEQTEDRVLLALHDRASPHQIRLLRTALACPDDFFHRNGWRTGNLLFLLRRTLDYFGVLAEEVERLKELEDEIQHYRHISVTLETAEAAGVEHQLREAVRRIRAYRPKEQIEREKADLKTRFQYQQISLDDFMAQLEELNRQEHLGSREERVTYRNQTVRVRHVARHYYLPVVLSESERVDFLQHIITVRSEVEFVNALESYLKRPDHRFREFDWWLFSKLDESLDQIYLPYYDPDGNRLARYKPDFIFWLQRGEDYFVVFVDPKGTEYRDADRKLEGYRRVFEEAPGRPRVIPFRHLRGRVFCFFWTTDTARIPETSDRRYWVDRVGQMLERVLGPSA